MVKQKKSGGTWYYEFMSRGKRYFGTCEGCKNRRDAESFERSVREKALQGAALKSVKALYETFREDLTGGEKITLDEAFDLAEQKPRPRIPSEKHAGTKRTIWGDFLAFMHGEHSDVKNLIDVTEAHAQEYIGILQKSGRYDKSISYSRGEGKRVRTISTQNAAGALSPRSIRLYQMVCTEVFTLLAKDAGLQDNPFSGIRKAQTDAKTREAFTAEELKTIHDNLDDFTRPLFMMAVWTGLREGDICTLKWSDVDLENRLITRETRKTGAVVQIPISKPLYSMLTATPRTESEYVFPKHAEMYLKNSDGVSYRVKKFLEGLGIQTTRKPEGRTRAISVKDLHSCRHTFCYFAGMARMPLSVVQSIVGHMSPEMTKHYMAHASIEDKRRAMDQLSFFTQDALPATTVEPERTELHSLIDTLPIEQVREVLELCKRGGRKS
jgi:integrase